MKPPFPFPLFSSSLLISPFWGTLLSRFQSSLSTPSSSLRFFPCGYLDFWGSGLNSIWVLCVGSNLRSGFGCFCSMGDAISGGFGDDLMLRFSPEMNGETKVSTSEQPDLTLGLSLGGIYCRKLKESSLTRSSSVIGVISQNAETWKWDMQRQQRSFLSLARSCSFPAETDQLGRIKLKELQLMRRMEAKKRLAEQRSGRAAAAEDEKAAAAPPSPSEVAAWAAASAARSPAVCRATDKIKSTQGSLSQNYTIEGHGSVGSTKGSSTSQSSLESNDREPQTMASREKPGTNAAKRCRVSKGLMEGDGGMDVMRTMPSVTTIGDGPNGRKVEGFLYKYMKGQVCIVCVCHGSFLTPAEFVKHAGGREVANPMKHIHVCCTSFSL